MALDQHSDPPVCFQRMLQVLRRTNPEPRTLTPNSNPQAPGPNPHSKPQPKPKPQAQAQAHSPNEGDLRAAPRFLGTEGGISGQWQSRTISRNSLTATCDHDRRTEAARK